MNYASSTRQRIADISVGIKVDKAAIAIAGATTKSIFTVAGGRILVKQLVGEVTVNIQNQANAAKFVSTPTVGVVTDMCGTGQTQDMRVGGLVSLPGTSIATAMNVMTTTAEGAVPGCATTGIIVPEGTIGFNTAADSTGSMSFSIWYVPLDEGAYVTAA